MLLEEELCRLPNPPSTQRPQELRQALLDAIERLPQLAWQQVLLLRYFHNLTPAEIAREMDKTASAVYKGDDGLERDLGPIGYKYE